MARMDTGAALKELRRMKGIFKSLEHLEEVLIEVLNADSDLAVAGDSLKSVRKETEKANGELSDVKGELASFQKNAKERMSTITTDHLKKEEEMQREFNEKREAINKAIKDLTEHQGEVEKDGDTRSAELNVRIKGKEGILSTLTQDIKRLRESAIKVEVE